MATEPRLPFDADPDSVESRLDARDRAGRARAVDPRYNVALEASAGTGKTRVLVERYIALLRAGVHPANILAITFTRKAAAEMRERILTMLRESAANGTLPASRWREIRDRVSDIGIATIDAFCLSLLAEFPLEADLDPGFSLADETETPRLIQESLDRAMRICRRIASADPDVALVFAQLSERRARAGLTALLNRRLVAPGVLRSYLASGPANLTVARAARAAAEALLRAFTAMPGGPEAFFATGPDHPTFALLERSVRRVQEALTRSEELDPGAVRAAMTRVREYFLTQEDQPRKRPLHPKALFRRETDRSVHASLITDHAPAVVDALDRFARDLNVLLARGTWRMYAIAEEEYRRTLNAHALLDFPDLLQRALQLLRQMEEFSRSRYRLESRYHHVLVDEFQDTSRAQWELISLLVEAWGAGVGAAHGGPLPPSIFIVGDRKQSIYAFRDADVSLLHEAARYLDALRPDGDVRRSIARSFRSVQSILSFVNDVCRDIEKRPDRPDAFVYDEQDRFPLDGSVAPGGDALGVVLGETPEVCAGRMAAEIARLLAGQVTVRDRGTGVPRAVEPGDIAILFRTRESHRVYEEALERRGIPAYVYKGLGFFDADEIKDVIALLWYLADPLSDLRTAAFLRSRFVRLSDEALRLLAPRLADALRLPQMPEAVARLDEADRRAFDLVRSAASRWRGLADRLPPAEMLDRILVESAYAVETRGPRFTQARENLKKLRSLVRRLQNRGYATVERMATYLDRLAVGDESNATVDAVGAVNLMTVHASKGLEFPVVFLASLSRGTGRRPEAIRVSGDRAGEAASVSVGAFQSDADDDDAPKEREETKRLLYVALTRARDRLYLSSQLREGRVPPNRGSLAASLPASLLQAINASAGGGPVDWVASSGTRHQLAVCGDQQVETVSAPVQVAVKEADFEPILEDRVVFSGEARVAPAALPAPAARPLDRSHGSASSRVAGTLVHRLLQRFGFREVGTPGTPGPGDLQTAALRAAVAPLLRSDEAGDIEDLDALVEEVVSAYSAFCGRGDVRALCARGERLHEVPFTLRKAGVTVRGTIDCLVRDPEGRITVLEFKTGRPRPEHQAQLDLYVEAAVRLFAGHPVAGVLAYADEADR